MKTAISIPDDLFLEAERFARQSGKSRSELFRDALSEYLARRDSPSITQALNEVLADLPKDADPWLAEAGRRTLLRSEW